MDAERAVAPTARGPVLVRTGVAVILGDLDRHARERPGEPAVVEIGADGGARELTWSALAKESERVARLLRSLGVQAGDPVAFQLPNRLEFVTIALGALRIGAVCEPLMPIFRERELEFMLRESGSRVLFVPDEFRGRDHASMADGLRSVLPELEHVIVLDSAFRGLLAGVPDDQPPARRPRGEDVAQLLFTSGTSGEPKGALHRHDVLTRAADHHIEHFGLGGGDVIYIPSPLAHQTGFLYGMWIAIRLGAAQVLQEVWDAEVGLDAMQRFGVTFVQAATPFLADLARVAQERGERPGRLRTFVATGAAIPRELARRARETLGAEVGGAWGTTESCLGCAFAPGDPPERAWGTDGRALAGVELRVTDGHGRVLAAGEEGNFEVHTDCLFAGYLGRPELTAGAVTSDGWYRTGDLARIDSGGYVRITGRVKDVINRGGEKVPVAEIEQLLHAHPAVRDVAIVAMPDERLGERACAFVVVEAGGGLDFDAMIEYLDSRRVSKTYWPERLELVDTLPRTPSGKIQKFVLRDLAREFVTAREVRT
jgi:cyclohexanecarboxylate-CoA ligase